MSEKRIPFMNNKGHTMYLSSSMKLAEFIKMGVINIRIVPRGTPLQDGEWSDVTSPKQKKDTK